MIRQYFIDAFPLTKSINNPRREKYDIDNWQAGDGDGDGDGDGNGDGDGDGAGQVSRSSLGQHHKVHR